MFVALVLLLPLLLPAAAAHPASSGGTGEARSTVGHRLELAVSPTTVDLRYIAEIPERRVLEEARGSTAPGYSGRLLDSLADSVQLTWNGAPLPATRQAVADAAKAAEPGFLDFTVAWQAALPSSTGTLGVRNNNFPDQPSFFATSMMLSGDLVAETCSLLSVRGGRVRDNWHGAWVRDETAREPWVRLRPAGWGESASAPEPLPLRMAGLDAGEPPWWVASLLLLTLLPIALLGRHLGQRAYRIRAQVPEDQAPEDDDPTTDAASGDPR